jgi:hypothetical protein
MNPINERNKMKSTFLLTLAATIDNHFIPPAIGAIGLVGGIVLLLVKPKSV